MTMARERYLVLLLGVENNPVPSHWHVQKELFILSKINYNDHLSLSNGIASNFRPFEPSPAPMDFFRPTHRNVLPLCHILRWHFSETIIPDRGTSDSSMQ